MSEHFTEIRRRCLHCDGAGYAAVYYSHRVALDLLVDAADAARFSSDEARRLYRLAAKYEDESATQAAAQHWKSRDAWAALHRRNAIYLRAVAEAPELTEVQRRVATLVMTIGQKAATAHGLRLSIVTPEPAS